MRQHDGCVPHLCSHTPLGHCLPSRVEQFLVKSRVYKPLDVTSRDGEVDVRFSLQREVPIAGPPPGATASLYRLKHRYTFVHKAEVRRACSLGDDGWRDAIIVVRLVSDFCLCCAPVACGRSLALALGRSRMSSRRSGRRHSARRTRMKQSQNTRWSWSGAARQARGLSTSRFPCCPLDASRSHIISCGWPACTV